jgi:hypothetical protein
MLSSLVVLATLCCAVPGAEYEFQWVDADSVVQVPDGVVWVYHYAWGDFQRHKLADIREGRARIEVTARTLAEEVQPASNTRAFLLVLEFPTNRWYRTVDLDPKNFLRDYLSALDALGTLWREKELTVIWEINDEGD